MPIYKTITSQNGTTIYVWKIEESLDELNYGDIELINKIPRGQIVSKERIKVAGVIFAGRYGAWDRSWKIERVVREALKWKDLNRRVSSI